MVYTHNSEPPIISPRSITIADLKKQKSGQVISARCNALIIKWDEEFVSFNASGPQKYSKLNMTLADETGWIYAIATDDKLDIPRKEINNVQKLHVRWLVDQNNG